MKGKIKRYNIVITLVVLMICLLAIYFCVNNSKYKEILVTIASVIAAAAVLVQIRDSKQLATGEFVLNLQQEFTANENNSALFIKCWNSIKINREEINNKKIGKKLVLTNDDEVSILNYLTFFESLYIMVEKNVLSIKMLDELFGRRFFVVVNNIEIQDKDLGENYLYYLNVYRLYNIWEKYRRDRNENVFYKEKDNNNSQENKDCKTIDYSKLRDLKIELANKLDLKNNTYYTKRIKKERGEKEKEIEKKIEPEKRKKLKKNYKLYKEIFK